MKELMMRFWNEEDGFGTVELVILIGVLVAIALVFRDRLGAFVNNLMNRVFNPDDVPLNTDAPASS